MRLLKLIIETNRLAKDFEKRIKEVERNVIKPKPSFMGRTYDGPLLHEEIDSLKTRINFLEKENEILYKYLGVKKVYMETNIMLKKKKAKNKKS